MKETKLNDLQNCELEMLKEFIRVCDKLNLKYYIYAGTLLGAVRHKGFIPWDDDIDVCMLRNDYEVFMALAPYEINKKFFVQNFRSDKNYLFSYAKLRNNETTFIEHSSSNLKINHGVYLDIFVLDNYDINEKFKNFWVSKVLAMCNIKISEKLILDDKLKDYRHKISRLLFKLTKDTNILELKEKIYGRNKDKNCQYLRDYSSIYSLKNSIIEKSWLGKGKKMTFDGVEVIAPENYDAFLKNIYGDYMKLPPVEKRISGHKVDNIDLKHSYKIYEIE